MKLVLTFDDGLDVHESYAAIGERYNAHFTFYVPTRIIGKQGHLTEDELRTISNAGHEIGAHGVTHRSMIDLTAVDVEEEGVHAQAILQKITGRDVVSWAYPYGQRAPGYDSILGRTYRNLRGISGTLPYLYRHHPGAGVATGGLPFDVEARQAIHAVGRHEGNVMIVYAHAPNLGDLYALLDTAQQRGVPCVTMNEGLR